MAVHNGELYAGGLFITAGGSPANYIAKWDGTSWLPLGIGMNNHVNAISSYNNELYAGGLFTTAGGNIVNYIAKWDGTSWLPLGIGMNNSSQIMVLAEYNGELYTGGNFIMAGGNPANNIAKWNGTVWTALGMGTGAGVHALSVYNGDLFVGGEFNNAGGNTAMNIARWNFPAGVEENVSPDDIRIFPNPVTNNFTIETSEKSEIEILNIEGQLIKTFNTAEKQTTIDVADFASGIYFIKAKTDRGVAVRKFIKE